MPPALHDELTKRAADQGVSLNQLVVALLAGGVGFKLPSST
jgi:predicted HicB family RNase H-like nuclease